jgi:HK97 family phage portal protein
VEIKVIRPDSTVKINHTQSIKSGGIFSALQSGFVTGGVSPALSRKIYELSDSFQTACNLIARAFCEISPVLIDTKTNDILAAPEEHRLLKLLYNPCYGMSMHNFLFELMISYLTAGETYPEIIGNTKFEPGELSVIPAYKTTLTEDVAGDLQSITVHRHNIVLNRYNRYADTKRRSYVYRTPDGLRETINIHSIVKMGTVRGLSCTECIINQINTKQNGARHNNALLANGARPSALISSSSGEEAANCFGSQESYESFVTEVKTCFSGERAGTPIVSPAPLNYQNMMITARDMDYINLINTSRNEIYSVLDIPLPLINTGSMTLNNYENAITALYDIAILPRANFLYDQLGRFLLPRYKDGDRYRLGIDERKIPALKKRALERALMMGQAYVFSDNEIRHEAAYESAGEEGDLIYKPSSLIAVGDDDYTGDLIKKPEKLQSMLDKLSAGRAQDEE